MNQIYLLYCLRSSWRIASPCNCGIRRSISKRINAPQLSFNYYYYYIFKSRWTDSHIKFQFVEILTNIQGTSNNKLTHPDVFVSFDIIFLDECKIKINIPIRKMKILIRIVRLEITIGLLALAKLTLPLLKWHLIFPFITSLMSANVTKLHFCLLK